MSIAIRDALPEEHDAAIALVLAGYAEFGSDALWEGLEDDIANVVKSEDTDILLAQLDGRLLGTIAMYPDGRSYWDRIPSDWACLRTLAVLPEARGRGVGRALMNECVRRARSLGRSRLLLHTMPFMKAAISLHESLGFRRAPELDVEYSGTSAIAYALDLDLEGVTLSARVPEAPTS